jgi:hypothetical protein
MSSNFGFKDYSGKIKKELLAAMERGMEKALLLVEAQVKALTPVDTGALRDNIGHSQVSDATTVTGVVGSPYAYAIYIEYGTGEYADNGQGRKGGWAYVGADGKKHFTRGNKPYRMFRDGFSQTAKAVEAAVKSEVKF